ncbi:MAG: glycosyltransferase [Bacteroidota bacterium]|nr:glycosyltransferase [Bacteroidota bacterium]
MPRGDRPLVSVIIVNYNVRDLLANCLHSLRPALHGITHEIFVVDNDSDDGSVEMLERDFPAVRVFRNPENVGFARANNIALAHAAGDFILLLNPDTLVQEDTVATLIERFREHPDVGMAGCKILTPNGTLEPACRRSFPSPWVAFTKLTGLSALFPRSRLFARYNMTYRSEDETYEVDAISGSFMMLRREVYERVGGLDESYFMYGEDLDWCHRIRQAGWRILYVHETKIVHYGGESTRRSSIDAQTLFYRAMEVFVRKNLAAPLPFRVLIHLGIRTRLLLTRGAEVAARLAPVLADGVLASLALAAAELMRYGKLFSFPPYAYPTVYIAVIAVFLFTQLVAGAYTRRDYAVTRSAVGAAAGFFVLSSVTYFFKEYAFSRFVVILAGTIAFILLPARRILASFLSPQRRMSFVTGRPTLLVGLTEQAFSILDRLRRSDAGTYRVTGLIDVTHKHLGETFGGVEVVGSVDNIAKVVTARKISDVIFSPDALPYTEILSIIYRTRGLGVQFRIVPPGSDVLVGKSGIDHLTTVPLIDIEYNLARLPNRFLKRSLDIVVSLACLICLTPFVSFFPRHAQNRACSLRHLYHELPSVLFGKKSLVGIPERLARDRTDMFLGKPGLTGVIQLRSPETLHQDEQRKLAVQYARHHSIFLDIEILLRTVLFCLVRRDRRSLETE